MNVITEIENLESMLANGQDNALIRFAMGNTFIKYGKFAEAISHLAKAIEFDPEYSAAWKLYGKALAENGERDRAIDTYRKGISVAEKKGDIQAVKEMRVFLKRLEKTG